MHSVSLASHERALLIALTLSLPSGCSPLDGSSSLLACDPTSGGSIVAPAGLAGAGLGGNAAKGVDLGSNVSAGVAGALDEVRTSSGASRSPSSMAGRAAAGAAGVSIARAASPSVGSSPALATASADCTPVALGDTFELPATYRDFRAGGDFEVPQADGLGDPLPGIVAGLDTDGKPVLSEPPAKGSYITDAATFAQWFRDVPGVNFTLPGSLTLWRSLQGTYANRWGKNGEQWKDPRTKQHVDGTPTFFPVDSLIGQFTPADETVVAAIPTVYGGDWNRDEESGKRNFGFTSEFRFKFPYSRQRTCVIDVMGDDDAWVFIGGKLAVDIGGIHCPVDGRLVIDSSGDATTIISPTEYIAATTTTASNVQLGLSDGKTYEVAIFQAERRANGATLRISLEGFDRVCDR